ncbi:MAG: hypothetical protein M1825_003435 [Sarcosagium campestre]|nr:MAG: hypothetical protein M1825_003435 [Sarcosagium campestre]
MARQVLSYVPLFSALAAGLAPQPRYGALDARFYDPCLPYTEVVETCTNFYPVSTFCPSNTVINIDIDIDITVTNAPVTISTIVSSVETVTETVTDSTTITDTVSATGSATASAPTVEPTSPVGDDFLILIGGFAGRLRRRQSASYLGAGGVVVDDCNDATRFNLDAGSLTGDDGAISIDGSADNAVFTVNGGDILTTFGFSGGNTIEWVNSQFAGGSAEFCVIDNTVFTVAQSAPAGCLPVTLSAVDSATCASSSTTGASSGLPTNSANATTGAGASTTEPIGSTGIPSNSANATSTDAGASTTEPIGSTGLPTNSANATSTGAGASTTSGIAPTGTPDCSPEAINLDLDLLEVCVDLNPDLGVCQLFVEVAQIQACVAIGGGDALEVCVNTTSFEVINVCADLAGDGIIPLDLQVCIGPVELPTCTDILDDLLGGLLPTNLLPTNLLPTNILPTNILPTNILPINILPTNILPTNILPFPLQ